jgi:hypothetical protein
MGSSKSSCRISRVPVLLSDIFNGRITFSKKNHKSIWHQMDI